MPVTRHPQRKSQFRLRQRAHANRHKVSLARRRKMAFAHLVASVIRNHHATDTESAMKIIAEREWTTVADVWQWDLFVSSSGVQDDGRIEIRRFWGWLKPDGEVVEHEPSEDSE